MSAGTKCEVAPGWISASESWADIGVRKPRVRTTQENVLWAFVTTIPLTVLTLVNWWAAGRAPGRPNDVARPGQVLTLVTSDPGV
jgi:hypothetical protein